MNSKQPTDKNLAGPASPHFCTDADSSEEVPAWTEIEAGRFMPRRVRGSNQGRALG
ncbi:MAG: hypothetical protein WAO83_26650 [Fuerstiella sp.]